MIVGIDTPVLRTAGDHFLFVGCVGGLLLLLVHGFECSLTQHDTLRLLLCDIPAFVLLRVFVLRLYLFLLLIRLLLLLHRLFGILHNLLCLLHRHGDALLGGFLFGEHARHDLLVD